MVKGKRMRNKFVSPSHKYNFMWHEKGQIIFYAIYPKSLFDGDYIEKYGISSCSSPN